jgi:serine/threonine protein kinase
MELGQGSLEDYFDENRVANISFKQLFGIVSQILVAISWWITEFGIVHNDLYLKNVVYKPIDYQQQQEEEEEKTRDFVYHSSSSSIDLQVHVDDILVKVIDFGLASINPEQHKQVAKDFNKTDYLYPIRFFFKDCKDGYYRHVLQYDIPPYARDILAVLQNIQIGYEWNDERIK